MEHSIEIELGFEIVEKFREKSVEYGHCFIKNNTGILCSLVEQRNSYKSQILTCLNFDKLIAWHQNVLIDAQRHQEDGHNFNIFSVFADELHIKISETAHSKLLKLLLNPRASHGQKKLFLTDFLTRLGICNPEEGSWSVTAEEGRVDVMLRRSEPHSVVIIENKSNWASDQPNQLYRYWYEHIFQHTQQEGKAFYQANKDRYVVVYLAPNSNKQPNEQTFTRPEDYSKDLPETMPIESQRLAFNDFVQKWLDACVAKLPATNHRMREYLAQYKQYCSKL